MPEVKEVAVLETKTAGGHGAVREALNFIMNAQGKLEGIVNSIGG
jgi:3-deoxy-D-manno-octulosonate 8-phosphate phosphatase (KDO 8-P phosphatase)